MNMAVPMSSRIRKIMDNADAALKLQDAKRVKMSDAAPAPPAAPLPPRQSAPSAPPQIVRHVSMGPRIAFLRGLEVWLSVIKVMRVRNGAYDLTRLREVTRALLTCSPTVPTAVMQDVVGPTDMFAHAHANAVACVATALRGTTRQETQAAFDACDDVVLAFDNLVWALYRNAEALVKQAICDLGDLVASHAFIATRAVAMSHSRGADAHADAAPPPALVPATVHGHGGVEWLVILCSAHHNNGYFVEKPSHGEILREARHQRFMSPLLIARLHAAAEVMAEGAAPHDAVDAWFAAWGKHTSLPTLF